MTKAAASVQTENAPDNDFRAYLWRSPAAADFRDLSRHLHYGPACERQLSMTRHET
jgi:hypothetical protein